MGRRRGAEESGAGTGPGAGRGEKDPAESSGKVSSIAGIRAWVTTPDDRGEERGEAAGVRPKKELGRKRRRRRPRKTLK
jgi:hypothetical protein